MPDPRVGAEAPWVNERLRRECYDADGGLAFELSIIVDSGMTRIKGSSGRLVHELMERRRTPDQGRD